MKDIFKTAKAAKILQENKELALLVFQTEIELKNYLDLTPLYLETVKDDKLLMSVATELPPKDALKRLHQFDNEWWIKNEPLSKGKLCIDVVSI